MGGKDGARKIRQRDPAMTVNASFIGLCTCGTANLFVGKNGRDPGSGGISSMKLLADQNQIDVCAHCITTQQVIRRSPHQWSIRKGRWRLAAVYSHTESPPHYHRRWWTLLPGSGWGRVSPHRSCHQLHSPDLLFAFAMRRACVAVLRQADQRDADSLSHHPAHCASSRAQAACACTHLTH